MLAKCANPSCHAPFLYLREGKLYQMEVGAEAPRSAPAPNNQPELAQDRKTTRRLEFFWLCGRCAQRMTLSFNRGQGVVVVPIRTQRAIAS
ncbi:MAG TPA: hypothetical protein VKR26_19085 [Terriglobales bacterium]|jgi:hypothetical protein|nr:hypothetical protein [Terriglobales bacterium]